MPNEYYQPTQAIVSNPYLRFSSVLDLDDYIKKDGNAVLGWNDSMHVGLFPLHSKYAGLLAETDLTLKYDLINMRFNNILTADDDNMKKSIEEMYNQVAEGTGFGIIVTKKFMTESNVDKIELRSQAHNMQLKDIIETKQYLIGSWYNEIGLNANYNMKREAINESEADMNEDTLLPFIDDMLRQREILAEQLNEKFADLLTKGKVRPKISSAWMKMRKEIEIREEEQRKQAEGEPKPSEEPEDVTDETDKETE